MLSLIYHLLFLMYLLSRALLEGEEGEGSGCYFNFLENFATHFILLWPPTTPTKSFLSGYCPFLLLRFPRYYWACNVTKEKNVKLWNFF